LIQSLFGPIHEYKDNMFKFNFGSKNDANLICATYEATGNNIVEYSTGDETSKQKCSSATSSGKISYIKSSKYIAQKKKAGKEIGDVGFNGRSIFSDYNTSSKDIVLSGSGVAFSKEDFLSDVSNLKREKKKKTTMNVKHSFLEDVKQELKLEMETFPENVRSYQNDKDKEMFNRVAKYFTSELEKAVKKEAFHLADEINQILDAIKQREKLIPQLHYHLQQMDKHQRKISDYMKQMSFPSGTDNERKSIVEKKETKSKPVIVKTVNNMLQSMNARSNVFKMIAAAIRNMSRSYEQAGKYMEQLDKLSPKILTYYEKKNQNEVAKSHAIKEILKKENYIKSIRKNMLDAAKNKDYQGAATLKATVDVIEAEIRNMKAEFDLLQSDCKR